LAEAKQALETARVDDLHRAAHSLKSNSATFGAMELSAVAQELEHMAKDGRLEGAGELIIQAEYQFVRAKAALEAVREELWSEHD
ncbi:MAG TPA: Hpt domain-containing protein, partial [Anaerolineae bacterium]|nr:Hpt domain-containing protein [Anaerolineae bacterium]